MFSVYLGCLVVGGGLTMVSIIGELTGVAARPAPAGARSYTLRALAYSLAAFGGVGVVLERLVAGPGTALTLIFALLAALAVGGWTSALLAFLARRSE